MEDKYFGKFCIVHTPNLRFCLFSCGSDVSNIIKSDQMVAPYHLFVFYVMTPKIDFFLIEAGTITPNGSMNTANFEKTSLFVEFDYKQVLVYGLLE